MNQKHNKNFKAQEASESAAKSFVTRQSFQTDPTGSYTGHPKEPDEKPEQDSDDL
jgi:hypothetical protein